MLGTLGELAVVGGEEIMVHKAELLPLIIDFLQDQSSSKKREARPFGVDATRNRAHLSFGMTSRAHSA